jgi:predicted Zn-dependent protease with MMP-like domain
MQAIREIRDIVSQELIVKLPEEFLQRRAEVIILSIDDENSDNHLDAPGALDCDLDALSWNMGQKLYTSREQLYER